MQSQTYISLERYPAHDGRPEWWRIHWHAPEDGPDHIAFWC
jgi:hypothetical protein